MKSFRARTVSRFVLACLALALAAPGAAAKPPGGGPGQEEPPFLKFVFPPELVMRNAREIELRPDQKKAITQAIQQTQSETVELGWSMQEAASDLARVMGQEQIDEEAALSAAERVMSIEARVKRAHLGLLIRIKNQLDSVQQQKLSAIRQQAP